MEVALDAVVEDEALGQRPRSMGAVVIGHVELAVEVEDREHQAVGLDFSRLTRRHLARFAHSYPHRAFQVYWIG